MADHGNDDELEEMLDAAEPSPLDFLAYLIDRVREALRVVREALRVDRVRKALRRPPARPWREPSVIWTLAALWSRPAGPDSSFLPRWTSRVA
jgi:hypothetical protein